MPAIPAGLKTGVTPGLEVWMGSQWARLSRGEGHASSRLLCGLEEPLGVLVLQLL